MQRSLDPANTCMKDRRQSNTEIDGIHTLPAHSALAPAQLYSTQSGRLFHSGRIVIVTVGLPARGKTHLSVALARYLRWLGVKTKIFHLGDYRRQHFGLGNDVPTDYFHVQASSNTRDLRNKIVNGCLKDIEQFLGRDGGQIAIYDAVNPLASGRRRLADKFTQYGAHTLFIESLCDDQSIIKDNVRNVKISSPDYAGWPEDQAVKHYLDRMAAKNPVFETIEETELNFIKMINAGERLVVNNCDFGYLSHRIVYYLLNLHIKPRNIYLFSTGNAREVSQRLDDGLSSAGLDHVERVRVCLMNYRGVDHRQRSLTIWTSTRKRGQEMAQLFAEHQCNVKQRSQMSPLNLGVCENRSLKEIKMEYPDEASEHERDPYHHRFPRAESYHDLAVRLEPLILELEREQDDLFIIAHESVLRVLYGYLMACDASDIPSLAFSDNEIVHIRPASYNNEAIRLAISGPEP